MIHVHVLFNNIMLNLMFCWPCIIVYQYSATDVMHFLFSLLGMKCLYMFRALLAHTQEVLHKRHLVYCVRVMSFGRTMALGFTQSVTAMSTRNNSWGKGGRCIGLTLPPLCVRTTKSWRQSLPHILVFKCVLMLRVQGEKASWGVMWYTGICACDTWYTRVFRRSIPVVLYTTVRSDSHCALRLWYVDLVVSIEVAVEVCCCFTVFSC
jgi:hypothetical protein